jgi:malate/lactate dehydrogenase
VKVAVVGRGRVGRGLSRALKRARVEHRLLDSRKELRTQRADVSERRISPCEAPPARRLEVTTLTTEETVSGTAA